MKLRAISLVSLLSVGLIFTLENVIPAGPPSLATVAEKSNFTKTSSHAEMVEWIEALAKQSPLVRLVNMGETQEKRKLPVMIIADPPVSTPEEAKKSGKMVVFAFGNIHAGEVDGKEGLLILARDIAMAKNHPLLKDLILLILPNFNADGGDKFGNNRGSQNGPPLTGTRHNSQNFDLNRDYVKLESPECQAQIRFENEWDPAIIIDCHTTNGSAHRYTLTYDSPRHPSNELIRDFGRDVMLPDVSKRLEKETKYKSFYYGNFGKANTSWTTTPAEPRYGFHYQGFRNRIGLLSESYSYAPFRDRVMASLGFVKASFEFAQDNKDKIRKLLADADKASSEAAPGTPVALRHKSTALGGKVTVLGLTGGRTEDKGAKPVEYPLDVIYKTEATLTVPRPFAYVFPAEHAKVVQNLQRHGINVEELREDIEMDVEAYTLQKVALAKGGGAGFGMHNLVTLDAKAGKASRKVKAGSMVVRTNQKFGTLVCFLLEPQAEDGLATWNYFDPLKEGQEFPVLRVPAKVAMNLIKAKSQVDDQTPKKKLTAEMVDNGTVPNFQGTPAAIAWLPDGEHFLQNKDGQLLKVHAVSGRSTPYQITDAQIEQMELSEAVLMGPYYQPPVADEFLPVFPQKGKGKGAVKGGGRELESDSPSGKIKAFVRGNNLFVEEVEGKKETALTKDGSDAIFNGKNDWVYMEEVVGRGNRKHYWWSPKSDNGLELLAFIRLDDTKVPKATLQDFTKFQPKQEIARYPNAGDPNPDVKFAVASAATGEVNWADLSDYGDTTEILVTRVGWVPDGKTAWFSVQDRCQTWLDFCTIGPKGGKPTKLFRETTKAWVSYPTTPTWLADGSLLFLSERTGWKHIYHYAKDGLLIGAVTNGNWEVRSLQGFDKEKGEVKFTGTKDGGTNSYKVKLDGSGMEKATKGKGDHDVVFSPRGDMFVTTYTEDYTPPRVSLHKADGTLIRVLDTNPVYIREEYQQGEYKRLQIPTEDGFMMEASITKPAKFDATKKYPLWVKTYGGPAAPQLKGGGGKGGDSAYANQGYVIMHIDPRSASGKGAVSAWACYKQLGVQELADIEDGVRWMLKNPWIDPDRVGFSGHSYGGFMAAFAITHSKMFAAAIAGAPPTDWRNYDSIYTERYMLTPKLNPEGYDATSCIKFAKNAHGRLLLAHGLMDDNVHPWNSIMLAHALQQANKPFDIQLYPLSRHGIGGAHYTQLQRDFMKMHLKPVESEK